MKSVKNESELSVRQIEYGTDVYKNELLLRDKVLRLPLGMSLFDEDLSRDKTDFHIAAFDGELMIGTLLLSVVSSNTLKMRQMAVDTAYQSKGIGRLMVQFAEEFAAEKGFDCIELNARKTAVRFYQKLDYLIDNQEFLEIGIPHYKMWKKIADFL